MTTQAKTYFYSHKKPSTDFASEPQRSQRCHGGSTCVCVESVIIVLIITSALAITGDTLLRFNLITVPDHETYPLNDNNSNINNGNTNASKNSSSSSSRNNINSNSGRTIVIPSDNQSSTLYGSSSDRGEKFVVNILVMDILKDVFHYTSIGLAALFCAETILKLCAQYQVFSYKYQIFDAVVVALTLCVELTFHYVDLPEKHLYLIKYFVVLRMWRIPFVCTMIDRRTQDSVQQLEQDVEDYRASQRKAEEKCARLELALAKHTGVIRRLERALQTFSPDTVLIVERENTRNGSVLTLPPSPRQVTRKTIMGEEETNFSTPEKLTRQPQLARIDKVTQNTMDHFDDEHKIKTDSNLHRADHSYDSIDSRMYEPIRNGDQGVNDTLSDYQVHPPISQSSQNCPASAINTPARRKGRRSSSSEYLDYARLASLSENKFSVEDDTIPDKSIDSWTAVNGESRELQSNSSVPDVLSSLGNVQEGSALKETSSSTLSKTGGREAGDHQEEARQRIGGNIRRFSSCPEYAYTKRLTLTSDESALIADDQSSEELSIHDNLGFKLLEEERLHVLAEFDGTTTYRSEEGIPMTSL